MTHGLRRNRDRACLADKGETFRALRSSFRGETIMPRKLSIMGARLHECLDFGSAEGE